jgi:hypothetical protein
MSGEIFCDHPNFDQAKTFNEGEGGYWNLAFSFRAGCRSTGQSHDIVELSS